MRIRESFCPQKPPGYGTRLFFKNLTLMLLLTLLPILIAGVMAFFTYRYASREDRDTHGVRLAESAADRLDTYLDGQAAYMKGLSNTRSVRYFLIFPESGGALRYSYNSVAEFISMQLFSNNALEDVMIYSEMNQKLISAEGLAVNERFHDAGWLYGYHIRENGQTLWAELREATNKYLNRYSALTLYYCPTLDFMTDVGVIAVNIDASLIHQLLDINMSSWDRALYLADANGPVYTIYGSTQDLSDCALYPCPLSYGGLTMVAAVDKAYTSDNSHTLLATLLVMVSCGIVIAILLSVLLYRRILSPFSAVAALVSAPIDEVSEELEMPHDEELGVVQAVQRVLDRSAATSLELKSRVESLKHMQSVALQAQINPHMLYNTLDSINWTVMGLAGVENDASMMITLLASVLRYAADSSTLVVTFFTELEHMQEYVELQKLRYENKFRFELDADERILPYSVIRLILQPVLENAIEHGMKRVTSGGLIRVSVVEDGSLMRVTVSDNGPGMDAEKLQNVRDMIENGSRTAGRNIGMYNVHQRLRLYYGDPYGLHIASEPGKGTEVVMEFPKEK